MHRVNSLPDYLLERYKNWKTHEFPDNRDLFRKLAVEGQTPQAMVIACCDSRVAIEAVFGQKVGEVFVHRNIANLVPPYTPDGQHHGTAAAVESRSPERFGGRVPEPRRGIRSGHMPGALNVHYARLVDADGRLKNDEALRDAFAEAGVVPGQPVVTTCGSGVTAAILSMALERVGNPSAVYDGSWTEWGGDPARPITTDS